MIEKQGWLFRELVNAAANDAEGEVSNKHA
jgi:hypothetical protein